MRRVEPWLFLLLAVAHPATAWHGHLKYRLDQAGGGQDHSLDLRLAEEWRQAPWQAQVDWELLAAPNRVLPDDRRRLLRLSREAGEHAVQRLDRLAVGYAGERLVLRLGRQAVSWGNGLGFHPLDMANPFAPTAIDKDYKTGDDMLYGQWLFDGGDDAQLILLPRRNAESGSVRGEESTLALKYHAGAAGGLDYDILAARHYAENVFGLGWSKTLGGAVWRLDSTLAGAGKLALASNLDYSWSALGKNFYGYLEYFHNSLGAREPTPRAPPVPELQARMARGEVFTRGRDYLSGGLQVELDPLFNLYLGLLSNWHERSGILQLRGVYDWQQDFQLSAGLEWPYGGEGGEFAGIIAPDGTRETNRRLYLRLLYYF